MWKCSDARAKITNKSRSSPSPPLPFLSGNTRYIRKVFERKFKKFVSKHCIGVSIQSSEDQQVPGVPGIGWFFLSSCFMIFDISFVKWNCQEICPSKQASINIHAVLRKPVRGFLELSMTDVLYLWVTFKLKPEKSQGNSLELGVEFYISS